MAQNKEQCVLHGHTDKDCRNFSSCRNQNYTRMIVSDVFMWINLLLTSIFPHLGPVELTFTSNRFNIIG